MVLGIDALDPELVDSANHPNLTLDYHRPIDTINSDSGAPSTHELWPSIITGLHPQEHGLLVEDGVSWGNPFLELASTVADYALPDTIQTRVGGWLLTNTDSEAFRAPRSYYSERGISTIFDGIDASAIGVPNYVVDPSTEDREQLLRRSLGDLFQRDPAAVGGHRTSDLNAFYEKCMEMVMIRITRARRGLRGGRQALVFAYTSGLDLIGHVSHTDPEMLADAYTEIDDFVGELRADLAREDELVIVSDHGLQEGIHTEKAIVAATSDQIVRSVESVLDIRSTLDAELRGGSHDSVTSKVADRRFEGDERVRSQLEDLGYF